MAASHRATREQRVVRILFLMDRAGEPPGDAAPEGAYSLMRGQTRLQALDFWLRNPDYLAYELLTEFHLDPAKRWALSAAGEILGTREPEIRRLPMAKYRHGAFERLDDSLAVLTCRRMVVHEPRAGSRKVHEHNYWLTESGHAFANQLLDHDPVFQWYADRADLIGRLAGDVGGAALKDRQYRQPEYAETRSNHLIPPIADRVRDRLAELKERS